MLRHLDSFWLSFADKVTTWTCHFVSLIVAITLLESAFALSVPAADKIQCFGHVSFHYNLQLFNGISSGLQKLFGYFSGTAIVVFFRIPLALFGAVWAAVFPKNVDL